MYESIAQFADAARYYEVYAERLPRGEKVSDALYDAVLLRVTAGAGRPRSRTARASSSASRGTRRPTRSTASSAGRTRARRTGTAPPSSTAGNERAAAGALDDAARLGRRHASRLEQGLYHAAQARYMQGDRVLAQYEQIQIAGDADGLRRRLQRKSEFLQEAALIYADVVEFRVAEWVTAALFPIGRSYELFAEGLRGAPIPEGLTDEEEQSYRDQLAMFIIPIEERALEAYEGGYQKAVELRIYNRWTQRLREALTRLNDVVYPPLREMGGDIIEGEPLPMPEPLDGLRRGDSEEAGEQAEEGES